MKTQKRILSIVLSIFMLLSVLPFSAAFAEENEPLLPEDVGTEVPWGEIEPTFVDETDGAEPEYIVIKNGDETTYYPVAPAPNASVAVPEDPPAGVDWDLVAERMFQAAYNGERVNMLDLEIPYSDAVRDFIFRNNYYNPRFLRMGVYYNTKTVNGVTYLEYVGQSAETSAVFRQQYDASVDALESLMRGVTGNTELSDLDKCLILHDRLCTWCEYDYVNYLADEVPETSFSAYGALALRVAVCNGIALAYGWMLDLLGIENYYTSSQQINHGWNMVYIDGEPYYVDCTWDDPTWDRYGSAAHKHFMQSFPTFSAGHRQSTDYSDAPVSTIYEDYFCTAKKVQTEICLIDGDMYYLDNTHWNNKLIRRSPAGVETELITVPYYTVGDGSVVYPYMLNIGHTLLYTQRKEIHAYDVRTGTDTVVFRPDDSYFPDEQHNTYGIMGFRQIDGVLEVYVYNAWSFKGTGMTQAEFDELRESHRLTFTFCEHDGEYVIEQLKGPTCQEYGEARTLCPDCGKLEYVAGEGVLGDHSFTAETVNTDTKAADATCTAPAQYYYSCEYCGLVKQDDAHTFSDGEPAPHAYAGTGADATPTCPGHMRYLCPDCGAVAYDGFTFYDGNSACGVIDDSFAWQIVNGVLSVCGAGAMPDFTADALPGWHDYADSVTSLVVNDDITAIGGYNFYGLSKMAQMTLPDSLVSIGNYAFGNDSSLTGFVMPPALLSIGNYAFTNCSKIASITNNEVIQSIGSRAFSYITQLQDIVIPGSVVNLGSLAFYGLINARSVIVEEGTITRLPAFFFYGYTSKSKVEEIRIPSNITYIDQNALTNSLGTTAAINVSPENPNYTSVDGVLYSKDLTTLYKYPGASDRVYYHVPESVTSIGSYAVTNTFSLKYLDLRDTGIIFFPSSVFHKVNTQLYVNLPAGLSRIDTQAFNNTITAKTYIPDSVISVANDFNYQNKANDPVYYTNSSQAKVKEICDAQSYTCVVLDGHTHAFTEQVYSEDGDCQTPGVSISLCDCGEFEITHVPAAHNYNAEEVKDEALKTAATCTSAAVYYYSCTGCGAVEHNDAHTFTSGSTAAHNYTAAVAKAAALKTPATCQSAAVYYYSCNVCGAVEHNDAHTFTSGSTADHSYTAAVAKDEALKTPATCTSLAVYFYSCTGCGAVEGDDAHTFTSGSTAAHNYNAAVVKAAALKTPADCQSAAVYYYSCADCGAVEHNDAHTFISGSAAAHSYTAAVVKDEALKAPATCTSLAVYYYSCTGCGAVEHDDAHTFTSGSTSAHNYSKEEVKDEALKAEATCTSAAVYYYSCVDCGAVEHNDAHTFTSGSAADHNYISTRRKDEALKTPATCTARAVYYFSCIDCGAVEHNDAHTFTAGDVAEHNWEWKTDTPETCKDEGVKHQECSMCHETRNEGTVIPKNDNHIWDDGVVTISATCTSQGEKTFTCLVCGTTRTEDIGKTAHYDGNGDGRCDVCYTEIDTAGRCKLCGEKHDGFFGKIIQLLHNILYFFKNLFK